MSKPLRGWLAGLAGTTQVALDAEGAWQDPAGVLSHSLAVDPSRALERLAAGHASAGADPDWLAAWRTADELAAEAIGGVIGPEGLSEPVVAAELGALLPAGGTLFVASSMPVRDIESFWPARADPPRVLCNRGANGIDGTVSAAFGAAAGAPKDPVVLLIGDVALAHDIGGLLAARRLGLKLTIVLIDNGGGGIFDFLDVSRSPMARLQEPGAPGGEDLYTRHIATPTGLDFAAAAAAYGLDHERVESLRDFRTGLERALGSPRSAIVQVRSDRVGNVALHARVWEAVGAALKRRAAAATPRA